MEWHNKIHSRSHMGLITIRLKKKKDKAPYKNTPLLNPRCGNTRQTGDGSHFHHLPFVLKKNKKKNPLLDRLTTICSSRRL